MKRLTAFDEFLVHQTPEPLSVVQTQHDHWRESVFFVGHRPDELGDMVILTMATFPSRGTMDSLQMGNVGGSQVLGRTERHHDGDPHTMSAGGARIEVVKPFEELHLWADPDLCDLGMDLTFRARTQPYGLRRGSMRAGNEVVWDQSHMLQSGWFNGTYTHAGTTHEVRDWWGQRDHSWGIRNHGRCPMWMWLQLQLPDGFLGVWHWEFANGAQVYSDGCWAPADGSDPIPLIGFRHDFTWLQADGTAAHYGDHGETVARLHGTAVFTLEGGRSIEVTADGRFDRPYEPFQRGGLSQVQLQTDDGRRGTGIIEITGSHHHRYFPDTTPPGPLPE
jgi:hypothetical protein